VERVAVNCVWQKLPPPQRRKSISGNMCDLALYGSQIKLSLPINNK